MEKKMPPLFKGKQMFIILTIVYLTSNYGAQGKTQYY